MEDLGTSAELETETESSHQRSQSPQRHPSSSSGGPNSQNSQLEVPLETRKACVSIMSTVTSDLDIAERIEKSVILSSPSINLYSANIIKCVQNLRDAQVLTRIKSGEWEPEDLHNVPRELLRPDKWKKIHDNHQGSKIRKKGISKCPRCKSWFTRYILVQIRSGDEGMTQKFTCDDCEFAWKM